MERRDYLMMQVEQLGAVLRKLLSMLLNTKDIGTETTAVIDQELSENLGYNTDELLAIEDDRWIETLLNTGRFNTENLEKLADLLLSMAENDSTGIRDRLYRKSLMIYKYLEKSEKTYSMERNANIEKIESKLKNK